MILFTSDINVGFALDLNSHVGLLLYPLKKTQRGMWKLLSYRNLSFWKFLAFFHFCFLRLDIMCNTKVQRNWTKEMYFQNKIFHHLIPTE